MKQMTHVRIRVTFFFLAKNPDDLKISNDICGDLINLQIKSDVCYNLIS